MTTGIDLIRQAHADGDDVGQRRQRRALAHVYEAYKPAEREQHEHVLKLKTTNPGAYAKLPQRARSGAESYASHRDAWKEINNR